MATEKARRKSLPHLLPEDIILEILLQLPVKSLVRFRCICKSWVALIDEPGFTKRRNQRRIIFSAFNKPPFSIESMDFEGLDNNLVTFNLPLKKTPKPRIEVLVLGSCNGLLLCKLHQNFEDNLFLCNPTTRQCKELPQTGFCRCSLNFYGFSYDSSTDDYKVVRGLCRLVKHFKRCHKKASRIKIYSRKTNSWKRIEEFPSLRFFQSIGALVNGFLHWKGDLQPCKKWLLIAFDLEKEKFREVPKPDFGDWGFIHQVCVLDGCLCVVCGHCERYTKDLSLKVWVMKEYGVKESWTCLLTIRPSETILGVSLAILPLCTTNGGELVLQLTRGRIVKYNFKEEKFGVHE
ncbi:F-box/kelch-repeat protein At3g23880-like [Cornus florida]|uniref:F-box/kelch-repeat protein At3g23880-like n=1 Tax=Cornus florida TaxID=4283 RepID=UPI0028A2DBE1|nr:F-box/kelch-repeat protein At3g23880-like [Cornus florida]